MRILTIISHTEHYYNTEGSIVGLGSTVTEINHLLDIFDEVHHVAMLHNGPAPASALPYCSHKIKFIPISAVGGRSLRAKAKVLWQMPNVINTVRKAINQSDYFQFRAPTGIGVYVIPYLMFRSKKGWFKYAGNWKQKQAPLAYKFQRWLLVQQNRLVTINGEWSDQPAHCLTFENPCLSMAEIDDGQAVIKSKTIMPGRFSFCFVGRLEKEKGIELLIKAFKALSQSEKAQIAEIHIVGDGKDRELYKKMADDELLNFNFHGFLTRNDVQSIYKKSHAIVLPSASEGFPKVIAEAINFGCIPVVSDVSGIGHYIKNKKNGFLLKSVTVLDLKEALQQVLRLSNADVLKMIAIKKSDVERFTYSYYNSRILNELIN